MLAKKLSVIFQIPTMIHFGYLLESERFDKLGQRCNARLNKRGEDAVALFFLMYRSSYKGQIFEARNFYFRLMKIKTLAKKTTRYFLSYVQQRLIDQGDFVTVDIDCRKLLKEIDDSENRILIYRLLCETNYKLWKFEEVRKYCDELKNDHGNIPEVVEFIKKYLDAIEIEERKGGNLTAAIVKDVKDRVLQARKMPSKRSR